MSEQKPEGVCNICGNHGELSYDHVPLRAAFNKRLAIFTTANEYWAHGRKGGRIHGEYHQKGYGGHTICVRCNNDTGRWYGSHFADWCKEGMEFYDKTDGRAAVIQTHKVRPLAILKQITTMFLSMHGSEGLRERHPSLVKFVLDPYHYGLNPRYRFWVYFVAPGPLRRTPPCAILNIHTKQITSGMEYSFPPYGYMLTIDSVPQDNRLFEISGFAKYGYMEIERIRLNLNTLPTHGPSLGDYREFEKITRKAGEPNVIIGQDFHDQRKTG